MKPTRDVALPPERCHTLTTDGGVDIEPRRADHVSILKVHAGALRSIPLLLAAMACGLGGCSGGGPLQNRVGASSLALRVGPGGATLRGDGGGPLEGLVLEIPAGALDRLVEVRIEPGPDIEEGGTSAASRGLRVTAEPDPGPLALPMSVTLAVELAEFRDPRDLVVLGRGPDEQFPLGIAPPRVAVIAEQGELQRATARYRFATRTFAGDMQVRLVTAGRLIEDASFLVASGYDDFVELTSSSIVAADQAFAEAQLADPYSPLANLLRAGSRLLVAFDDRRDLGPGFDSLGEIARALGIDVDRQSLLARVLGGSWPEQWSPQGVAPLPAEILAFARSRLRPVLELALGDLHRVPLGTEVQLDLPPALRRGSATTTEVDSTDVLALRAAIWAAMFGFDWLDTFDLEFDVPATATALGRNEFSFQQFFTAYPTFGRSRALPAESTFVALELALADARRSFAELEAESDPQDDDLVVFSATVDDEQRSVWREGLATLAAAAAADAGVQTLRLGARRGVLPIDLSTPLRSGAFEFAFGIPEFLDCLPLAGTMPRPDLGAVLPTMTQDRATDLLCLYGRHDVVRIASIVVDGDGGEWPATARLLVPADPIGDTEGDDTLRGVDLRHAWLALAGDDLALRIGLGSDRFEPRAGQRTRYVFDIRERLFDGTGASIEIDVEFVGTDPPVVEVRRDGEVRPVAASVAYLASELELAVDRFELFDPDEPILDRLVTLSASASPIDGSIGTSARDRTRGIAVRF